MERLNRLAERYLGWRFYLWLTITVSMLVVGFMIVPGGNFPDHTYYVIHY